VIGKSLVSSEDHIRWRMKRRQVRTALSSAILLLALLAVYHRHATTLAFVPPMVAFQRTSRSVSSKSLFYAEHRSFDHDEQMTRQAGLVQSVRDCRNFSEIHRALGRSKSNTTLSTVNPTVAASALRRISQLLLTTTNDTVGAIAAKELLPGLVTSIETAILASNKKNGPDLSFYALADVLWSMHVLNIHQQGASNLQRLATSVWGRLQRDNVGAVSHLGPRRLVECLQAASTFILRPGASEHSDAENLSFYKQICERLTKGDALSKLTPVGLSMILSSLSRTSHLLSCEKALVQAVARRLRKKCVRESATRRTLSKSLEAAVPLILSQQIESTLGKEIRTMAYTICKESVKRANLADDTVFTSIEACRLLNLAALLNIEASDPVVRQLCHILGNETLSTFESSTVVRVSHIMDSLERLQVNDAAGVIQRMGDAFVECVGGGSAVVEQIEPKDVNTILRCAALLQGRSEATMQPFQSGARSLFLDPSFIDRCSSIELSNFVWFALVARWRDGEVLETLATHILKPGVAESFSPKMACRTLSTFTAITASRSVELEETRPLEPLLFKLFDRFGEQLLSSQLTPLDVSSAIYSYARASYIRDMGIFDHLVTLMVPRVDEFRVRQVAQSLWACGKMMAWEIEPDEEEDGSPHPYLSSATAMAAFLAARADELNTKDVTQAMWAIGRLRIEDPSIVAPLAKQAKAVSKELTAQEIANLFWALSKVKSQEFGLIYVLMRRISCDDSLGLMPQEAANILYALGRLNIRDDEFFKLLSNIILERIELASAQSIANVLWAHRAVHITPPQMLLDSWAIEKLGLVAVQSMIESYDESDDDC